MTIRVTVVATGTDIEVGPMLDPVSLAVLEEYRQRCAAGVLECREHDNDPRLTDFRDSDGRVHGVWVYIQKRLRKDGFNWWWVICHHPGGTVPRHFVSHTVPAGKSPQHQWQQDYYERAAQDAGWESKQEDGSTVPGTCLDVRITGPAGVFGIEVQHSFLSVGKVRARHRKALSAGVTAVWSADRRNPDWAFKVPHVETNELPDGARPRGSWTVPTGPRRLDMAKCAPANFDRCPTPRSRNFCGRWHPKWSPMRGIVADDIAQQVPSGDLVVLDTHSKQGVILTRPKDATRWNEHYGLVVPQAQSEASPDNYCGYIPKLSTLQLGEEETTRDDAVVRADMRPCVSCQKPTPAYDQLCHECRFPNKCHDCGQRLLINRPGCVQCERCRLDGLGGS